MLFVNLFVGEIVLSTKGQHQLTGYAERYLGKWGKRLFTFSMVFGIYGALTAYLIGEGVTLQAIFGFGMPIIYTLIFFVLASFIVYKGVKALGETELILVTFLFVVAILISIFSYQQIDLNNLKTFDLAKIFLPYGVIVFAFMGLPAVPELQEVLGRDRKLMKKAIIVGSIMPIILYIIFTFVVMSVVGLGEFELLGPNQRIATVALSMYSLPWLGILANILAVLAMFTSFLTISLALIEMYHYDFGISRNIAIFLTLLLPLLAVLFNLTTFILILGVTGAITGGIDGILIILMSWKAKLLGDRKPEYFLHSHKWIGILLIVMFVFGVIYQLKVSFF